ncbi:MAG: hypothetical protein EAZ89_04050 [Bacteroidetes bacterium]|nr:MAG: hypothetical protein EAZ89_04050 [Bacteroidota bacterium]
MIHPEVAKHLPEIRSLCRTHQISKLWLFGSALRADFGPESDVDFLYELAEGFPKGRAYLDTYFGFIEKLEALFGKEVDMVWYEGIQNPYLKEEVDENKVLIYDKESEKVFI